MESITPWYIIVRDYQARAVVSGGPAVSREHCQYRENRRVRTLSLGQAFNDLSTSLGRFLINERFFNFEASLSYTQVFNRGRRLSQCCITTNNSPLLVTRFYHAMLF